METQILYLDNGTTITRMGNNFNRTYNVSEGRVQSVDTLHPSYNYTVRIAAATAAGIGPFSDPITVMTLEDGKCLFVISIIFILLVVVVPLAPPRNVTVEVVSSQSVYITWESPILTKQNGLIIAYDIVVKDLHEMNMTNMTVPDMITNMAVPYRNITIEGLYNYSSHFMEKRVNLKLIATQTSLPCI